MGGRRLRRWFCFGFFFFYLIGILFVRSVVIFDWVYFGGLYLFCIVVGDCCVVGVVGVVDDMDSVIWCDRLLWSRV